MKFIYLLVTQIVLKVTVVMKLFQHNFLHKKYYSVVEMRDVYSVR